VVAVSKAENVKKRKKSSKKKLIEPSARHEDAMQETNDIPKFDLAKQIMAEHRKITAVRRQGPTKKAKLPKKKHPVELIARNVKQRPIVLGPEQVIAEIVAKDIESLCMGNTQ